MLMMIAKMEASQQRGQPTPFVAARTVAINKRLCSRPVRQVRAEIEELQRRQDRRRCPKHQQVAVTDLKDQQIHTAHKRQEDELLPTKVFNEEPDIPVQKTVRWALVEVRIILGSRMAMMEMVLAIELIELETSIKSQADLSD